MNERAVQAALLAFERDPGEALVGEWRIVGIDLAELQALFGRPRDDPMPLAYAVQPEHLARLEHRVDHTIDLDRYDYFVYVDPIE